MKRDLRNEIILKLALIFLMLLVLPKVKIDGKNQLTGNFEISDDNLKQQIQLMVEEIYTKDRNLLKGINNIFVSKEDLSFEQNSTFCDGKILGVFFNGTILLKESGNTTNRKTLYHEIAHNIFQKIDNTKREEWKKLHNESENFVSIYASKDDVEDFAESFACYFTDFDNCTSRLESGKHQFIDGILD